MNRESGFLRPGIGQSLINANELPAAARTLPVILMLASVFLFSNALAETPLPDSGYQVQPGDILFVNVWRDEDLTREALVAPDGGIAFPLVGRLQVSGKTIDTLTIELESALSDYIDDPVVTVAVKEVRGSRVYVLGKVNRPGMYLLDSDLDVMQALSMAGGTTTYADLDNIRILRREAGEQRAMAFEYNKVSRGRRLDQNVLLTSGDVVVVN